MKKRYAARGLLDFKMALQTGGAIIRIAFTGGYMTANGVVPAKYATENKAIQHLIEKSDHYRTGKVYEIK